MFRGQANIPPVFVGAIVWIIQMGVDAGQWTLSPLLSRGLFFALLIAISWLVFVWVHNGLSYFGVPKWPRWSVQSAVAFLVPVGIYSQVGLPVLEPPNCDPVFEWAGSKTIGHNDDLDVPVMARFAKLVPRSSRPYAMFAEADGGGLLIFWIAHENRNLDPKPWQLTPHGIGYKAVQPGFNIAFIITAKKPDDVKLSWKFECLKGGAR